MERKSPYGSVAGQTILMHHPLGCFAAAVDSNDFAEAPHMLIVSTRSRITRAICSAEHDDNKMSGEHTEQAKKEKEKLCHLFRFGAFGFASRIRSNNLIPTCWYRSQCTVLASVSALSNLQIKQQFIHIIVASERSLRKSFCQRNAMGPTKMLSTHASVRQTNSRQKQSLLSSIQKQQPRQTTRI